MSENYPNQENTGGPTPDGESSDLTWETPEGVSAEEAIYNNYKALHPELIDEYSQLLSGLFDEDTSTTSTSTDED